MNAKTAKKIRAAGNVIAAPHRRLQCVKDMKALVDKKLLKFGGKK